MSPLVRLLTSSIGRKLLMGATGLLLIGLPGLAYPALVGWQRRRDACVALAISAALLAVVYMA